MPHTHAAEPPVDDKPEHEQLAPHASSATVRPGRHAAYNVNSKKKNSASPGAPSQATPSLLILCMPILSCMPCHFPIGVIHLTRGHSLDSRSRARHAGNLSRQPRLPSLSPCTGSRLPGLTRQGGKHTLQRPKTVTCDGLRYHDMAPLRG